LKGKLKDQQFREEWRKALAACGWIVKDLYKSEDGEVGDFWSRGAAVGRVGGPRLVFGYKRLRAREGIGERAGGSKYCVVRGSKSGEMAYDKRSWVGGGTGLRGGKVPLTNRLGLSGL